MTQITNIPAFQQQTAAAAPQQRPTAPSAFEQQPAAVSSQQTAAAPFAFQQMAAVPTQQTAAAPFAFQQMAAAPTQQMSAAPFAFQQMAATPTQQTAAAPTQQTAAAPSAFQQQTTAVSSQQMAAAPFAFQQTAAVSSQQTAAAPFAFQQMAAAPTQQTLAGPPAFQQPMPVAHNASPNVVPNAAGSNMGVPDMAWNATGRLIDPEDAGIQYLRSHSGKYNCHPKARRVKASLLWIDMKKTKGELTAEQASRLSRGAPIEDSIPGYDSRHDEDGILLNQQVRPSGVLALREAIREHHQYLAHLPGSRAAFPDGTLTPERRQQYQNNRDMDEPDAGCTVNEYAPDLSSDATLKSTWNASWYMCLTTSFIQAVEDGVYADRNLPENATEGDDVLAHVKSLYRGLKKNYARRLQERDAAQAALLKRMDRLRQRRSAKHQMRLRACESSPTLKIYWTLLKAVGAEGCSDDETDYESNTMPLTLRTFDLKWRSPQYAALLHHLDKLNEQVKANPLFHIGTVVPKQTRPRVRATNRDYVHKVLPRQALTGAPLQFYSPQYLVEAQESGVLYWLHVGESYAYALPNNL